MTVPLAMPICVVNVATQRPHTRVTACESYTCVAAKRLWWQGVAHDGSLLSTCPVKGAVQGSLLGMLLHVMQSLTFGGTRLCRTACW